MLLVPLHVFLDPFFHLDTRLVDLVPIGMAELGLEFYSPNRLVVAKRRASSYGVVPA